MSRSRPASALLPAALAAWALALLFAPPASNLFWALDGFRSAPFATLGAAAVVAAAALALLARRSRLEWPVVGALALVLAFALRERSHLVGDTQLRLRLLGALADPSGKLTSVADLSRVLHAQPLDALVSVAVPAVLARAGAAVADAVALVSVPLFLLLHGGVRRALGTPAPADGAALALAALASGLLLLYAGYADGLALTLAVTAWWWSTLDRPLGSPREALFAAALWLGVVECHRLGWVLLVPVAWRVLAPARAGDHPRARAWLAGGTVAAAALAAALGAAFGGSTFAQDAADLTAALTGTGGPRLVPLHDLANLVLLVLPLPLLAPALAGREAREAFVRSPSAALFAAALAPLLPLLLLFPVAPHGLGAHRDWDLAAFPALLAALAAARLLAHADGPRLRRALLLALPVLALQAGGWLAANADPAVGLRRAEGLVRDPARLHGEQASQVHVFLAYRAAGERDFATAARHFEGSAAELPNPRHELLAAQAWLAAGAPARAVTAYRRALAYQPLPPDVRRTAYTVGEMLMSQGAFAAPGSP